MKNTHMLGSVALAAALVASLPAAAAPKFRAPTTTPTATTSSSLDPVSGYLTSAPARTWVSLPGGWVASNRQTSVSNASISVGGVSRRYIVLRPSTAVANAPLMVVLHPNSTTPEATASLAEIADYVATQGYWAVLPAAVGGVWKDDPTRTPADDVNFVSALVTQMVGQGADASRVYVSGYSNGGFMATRLACTMSDRIAAFGIVAATTRSGVINTCGTPVARPKAWFLGTADNIVPYAGTWDIRSASATLSWWNGKQGCAGVLASSLPNRVTTDGTTVQQTRYTGCVGGGENQLYTVTGGGHTWPGGPYQPTAYGAVSLDIEATGLIWNFVRNYRR